MQELFSRKDQTARISLQIPSISKSGATKTHGAPCYPRRARLICLSVCARSVVPAAGEGVFTYGPQGPQGLFSQTCHFFRNPLSNPQILSNGRKLAPLGGARAQFCCAEPAPGAAASAVIHRLTPRPRRIHLPLSAGDGAESAILPAQQPPEGRESARPAMP